MQMPNTHDDYDNTNGDDATDDSCSIANTVMTKAIMTPDGKCVHHPWIELRGKDLASGQVYQRDSCPECNEQYEANKEALRQRKLELDRQLQALEISENDANSRTGPASVDRDGGGSSSSVAVEQRNRTSTSSESHSAHPQPYRPPLPPHQSSTYPPSATTIDDAIGYPYLQRQQSPRPPTAAGGGMMYSPQLQLPAALTRTPSSTSAASISSNQHIGTGTDAFTNGATKSHGNGNGYGNGNVNPALPFPPHSNNPYDPQYLAAFHHQQLQQQQQQQQASIAPATPAQQQDNQNTSLLWKLLQDKEDELKGVRQTLQETQRQFQEQSLLATRLQTTLDQVQAAFEKERLLIKLQAEKEAQESFSSRREEVFQKQLKWMESNISNNTNNNNTINNNNSRVPQQQSQQRSAGIVNNDDEIVEGSTLNQNSAHNSLINNSPHPIVSSLVESPTNNIEEEPPSSLVSRYQEVEAEATKTTLSSSKGETVTTNDAKQKSEKKHPWMATATVSPGKEKVSRNLVADDHDDKKEDINNINTNNNIFKIPANSNNNKKLYPSIDETLMENDVADDNNALGKGEVSAPRPSSSNSANQQQQQQQQQQNVVKVNNIESTGIPLAINMAETPMANNTSVGKKTMNESSDRFDPVYFAQKENEDEAAKETSHFPPVDDDRSLGQTVASSTYGDDRVKVVNKKLLDPYGDKGTFTGVVLRNTGMPHGLGRMVYEEDRRVFEGDWRHGRWHGYGRASFSNGDSYEGEYKFDQRHGTGVYRWNDGRVYDGHFLEDKRHGKGIFTWPDGAVYDGDFVNGQRQGHGKYTFADGGQYEGSWKDGRYDGFGTCTWEDGRRYRGEWRNGMAHGRGTETYPNGNVRHEGEWIDDEPIR